MKRNKLFITSFIALFVFLNTIAQAQTTASQDQNYIRTRTYTSEDGSKYLDAVQYYDGLGRPVEQVQVGITPSLKDLVSYQEYDAFGREDKAWLPAASLNNKGAFIPLSTYKTKSSETYNGSNTISDAEPYAYPVYETSPLSRVVQQYGPGKMWHQNGKAVKTAYQTNLSSFAVPYFTTAEAKTTVSITRSGNYGVSQLYVIETTDEDGNLSYEAIDKLGRLVYTKQMDGGTAIETCYVYDNFGNLRAVLPPLAIFASGTWTESTQAFKDYAYAYKYDNRNRCIAKKMPGADWIYYVYDNADHLIFTQDGENRKVSRWQFSIPDALGRVVLTGVCKNSLDYAANPLGTAVVKAAYNTSRTGVHNCYTITGITLTTPGDYHSFYFYDDYSFMGMSSEAPNNADTQYNAESGYGARYTGGYKGMLTGTIAAQLEPDGNVCIVSPYLYTILYYDNRNRLIQTKSKNHISGMEKEYMAYDFANHLTGRKHIHLAKTTQTEIYVHTYDHAGRLTKTTHQLNGGTVVTLAENAYDELGQLKTSQKHGLANLKTTYDYNIRSWISSINNPLFTEDMYYTSGQMDAKGYYNGNLTGISWTFPGTTDPYGCSKLGYNFTYDNLSRIKTAKFWRCGSYNQTDDKSMQAITYDKQGNILTLQRSGKTTATAWGLIDNLTMTYSGNQLLTANDAVAN
ncbi:MAG: DUF6443 domain-containing protein, partial [Candidatus Azobacteroides sp.]|nr:DUF6443 domain-containing protein [Candidatus Azobacteroides sp.]